MSVSCSPPPSWSLRRFLGVSESDAVFVDDADANFTDIDKPTKIHKQAGDKQSERVVAENRRYFNYSDILGK